MSGCEQVYIIISEDIGSDSVAEKCVLYVNQTPDMVTNLQLFHHSCSQVRKRKFQLDLLEEVLR